MRWYGGHIYNDGAGIVGGWLPASGSGAVDCSFWELTWSVGLVRGDGETLHDVSGIGGDLPVETVRDGDGLIDRDGVVLD